VRRPPLVRYRLRWPREVNAEQIQAISRFLATAAGVPVVIEARGTTDLVEHYLAVARGRAGSVAAGLRAILPGLALEAVEDQPSAPSRAVDLRLSTRRRPLRTDEPAGVGLSVLSALAHVGRDEQLILQWVLSRNQVPVSVPNRSAGLDAESLVGELAMAPFGLKPLDPEVRNALRSKQAEVGWRGVGRIGVSARSATRQRQLIRQVLGALRTAEAPGVGFRVRSGNRAHLSTARASLLARLRINALELATVAGWPLGSTAELPINRVASRALPPSKALPRRGRVIGIATFPGKEHPIALGTRDAMRHTWVIGPSGSGKSTLLGRLIQEDIAAGRGVVVIEPRGDLIRDVLARVPKERLGDVCLLDPMDRERPVGLNPLAGAGRSPELVADQLLGILHARYASSWGPRTSDILGSALLTLARQPGMTLVALPLLLSDAGFRRRVVRGIDDPIALGPFWANFEAWTEAERAAAIAPSMNKLRPFLLRPELLAVLGQARPGFDVRQVFAEKRILLVNLAEGQLGPESTAVLGSLVLARLWQEILGRSGLPPEKRHPVILYIDEYQRYAKGLPVDFADALAQARGLGVGLVLAHQYLHQLDAYMRAAVLSNAQSRVAFRLPHDDAVTLAAGSQLAPEDFEGLGAYEAYAQLVAGGSVQPWCSIKTEPLDPPISDPEAVRAASRSTYGVDRADVEASIRALIDGDRQGAGSDVGRRKRRGDGP
jgi:hypothetical protein